jgi:hypothetical protein
VEDWEARGFYGGHLGHVPRCSCSSGEVLSVDIVS